MTSGSFPKPHLHPPRPRVPTARRVTGSSGQDSRTTAPRTASPSRSHRRRCRRGHRTRRPVHHGRPRLPLWPHGRRQSRRRPHDRHHERRHRTDDAAPGSDPAGRTCSPPCHVARTLTPPAGGRPGQHPRRHGPVTPVPRPVRPLCRPALPKAEPLRLRRQHIEHAAGWAAAPARPVLLLLHDFPDPGKFHRFPCSRPPLGHIRQASDLRIYYR